MKMLIPLLALCSVCMFSMTSFAKHVVVEVQTETTSRHENLVDAFEGGKEITEHTVHFNPSTVQVQEGDTLTIVNTSAVARVYLYYYNGNDLNHSQRNGELGGDIVPQDKRCLTFVPQDSAVLAGQVNAKTGCVYFALKNSNGSVLNALNPYRDTVTIEDAIHTASGGQPAQLHVVVLKH